MLCKRWDKLSLTIISNFLFCSLMHGQSNTLPPIGGGPTGPTSPVTQSLAAQIVRGDFANKPQLLFTTWKTASDTSMRSMWMPDGQTSISRTQKNKTLIPPAAASVFQQASGSFLRTRVQLNHPAGATVFPTDSNLAGLLDSFLNACKTADSNFSLSGYNVILYFSQFHLNILHELYEYLIGIYATMNLTHYGVYSDPYLAYIKQNRQAPDPTSSIAQEMWKVSPIEDYTIKEDTYALNKKILIVNHLINIIEAQSNKAILTRFPSMPQHLATRAGMTMMKFDYGARLELLIDQQEIAFIDAIDPGLDSQEKQTAGGVITSMRTKYLTTFASYLNLFKHYTNSLTQGASGTATFVKQAQTIQNVLEKTSPQFTSQTTVKSNIAQLRSIQTINPPLFFYNKEAMRGIKIIPVIAQTLPQNSTQVPLPQKIISEAQAGTMLPFGNDPVAFYADDEKGIKQLYINIPTAQGMFSQKLIPQPSWLNSTEGVIAMLRACLGDFSALLNDIFTNESILDPCLTCILSNAAQLTSKAPTACSDCSLYLNTIRNFIAQNQSSNSGLPTIGGTNVLSSGPPAPGGGGLPNVGNPS